jgi:hypothetical protein
LINLSLGYTQKIIDVCKARGQSTEDTAYILATAYWETAKTMEPVKEAFYLKGKAEAYRKKLRYYPWYGRGFVQLTWKTNYVKAGKRLGLDFTKDPDLVMDPDIAARILVIGMEEGWFTSKKLSTYIDDIDESDAEDYKEYLEARRIINGVDKQKEIAKLAIAYEKLLREEVPTTVVVEKVEEAVVEKKPSILSIIIKLLLRLFTR